MEEGKTRSTETSDGVTEREEEEANVAQKQNIVLDILGDRRAPATSGLDFTDPLELDLAVTRSLHFKIYFFVNWEIIFFQELSPILLKFRDILKDT